MAIVLIGVVAISGCIQDPEDKLVHYESDDLTFNYISTWKIVNDVKNNNTTNVALTKEPGYKINISSKPHGADLTVQEAIDTVNSYGNVTTNETSALDGKGVFFADFNKTVNGLLTQGRVILMVDNNRMYTLVFTAPNNLTAIDKDITTVLTSFEPIKIK